MAARITEARYPSRCRKCSARIDKGGLIEVDSDKRGQGPLCMGCVDPNNHAPVQRDGTRRPVATRGSIRPLMTYEQLFREDD